MPDSKQSAPSKGKAAPDEFKGWLFKWTNYLKGYQRRWFVLSNGLLSYYSPGPTPLIVYMSLLGYCSLRFDAMLRAAHEPLRDVPGWEGLPDKIGAVRRGANLVVGTSL
ncbi:OSBP [Branchiostoma lanceolatum]|uniref:OSBP protein n=1 Tax=Branchiostoma lanceolatum TaxID=7740 RepID=A0A8J9WE26_BRALA|nr:OSBP [Branchiostoma lanceolatum]